jgi:hypothetical protein
MVAVTSLLLYATEFVFGLDLILDALDRLRDDGPSLDAERTR